MSGLDTGVPRLLLGEAAELTGLRKGRIYLGDAGTLHLRGTIGCGPTPPRWPETLVLDGEVEALLLRRVVVRIAGDAAVFGALQPHSRRAVLCIPLVGPDGSPAGVILFDDESGAATGQELRSFALVGGAAAAAWVAHHELCLRLDDLGRRHHGLQTAAAVERRLGALVGGPGGVAAMAAMCAEVTGKPVLVFNSDQHLVARAGLPERAVPALPPLADLLAADPVGPRRAVRVASRSVGVADRGHLLAVVAAEGETHGWVVILAQPSGLRPFDDMVAKLAGHYLAREFNVQHRIADVAWNARASLTRQLVKGTNDPDDLRTAGEYLGVKTDARRVLVYAVGPGVRGSSLADIAHLADDVQHRLDLEVLVTRGSEGVMLLIEAPPNLASAELVARVKAALRSRRRDAIGGELTAGISSVCEPRGLARAYREAREVAHCIDRFAAPGAARILAVDDLGPARLFVANSAVTAVRAYVEDVLGPLLTGAPGTGDLIVTLGRYFDSGRSVRISAAQLGVHENTVRLRLARVAAATGLDVASDPNDQLSAQTALLVLRLQGHPGLKSFDDAATDAVRSA